MEKYFGGELWIHCDILTEEKAKYSRLMDICDKLTNEKNEAFELLAQCTLRRNASEMRIEELKKQLMLMQIKLNNKEDFNDGKSGEHRDTLP